VVAAIVGAQHGHGPTPTRSEAAWVVTWGKWSGRVFRDLVRIDQARFAAPAVFRGAVRPFASCEQFEARVPSAPARYRSARERARQACLDFERLPALGERRLNGHTRAVADFDAVEERAYIAFEAAREMLRVRLSFNRRLPVMTGLVERSRIEPRLGRIASELAGRATEVRCWSDRDWPTVVVEQAAFYGQPQVELAGFAEPAVSQGAKIDLAPSTCRRIARYLYGRPPSDSELSFAVERLTHEAEHIRSPPSPEFVTDCYAAQDMRRTAELLGTTAIEARRLSVWYWRVWYPQQSDEYVSVECRPGGPLDETPGDGTWP
jgi:hypothetical protein